jgi:two-component system, chemotaxis family, sensor histidine kinase and response regulator PixL
MITDPSIREQGYIYFLTEAPELLQTIEQELFSLSEERTITKVHNLMRATHTLKGGAANVGLDVINKIAHYLEDVFKAFYNPDVPIDSELLTLLFQAYECLQLPLTAELNGTSINGDEILQRATFVFAQLQEKLGDALNAETHIPTSTELGFDIVESVFEVGVGQRINSIAEMLQSPPDNEQIADFMRSQAEVFIGLAESLNLPGFGELAQATLAALDANPSQSLLIAKICFTDLELARKAVIDGDRIRGGEASEALKNLSSPNYRDDDIKEPSNPLYNEIIQTNSNLIDKSLRREIEELYKFLTHSFYGSKNEPLKPAIAKFYVTVIRYILGWFNHELEISEKKLALNLIIPRLDAENSVEYLENWLDEFFIFIREEQDSPSLCLYREGVILSILLALAKFLYKNQDTRIIQALQTKISELAKEYKNYPPVKPQDKNWIDNPRLEQLLEIKEVSTKFKEQLTSEGLVESIWGEEITNSNYVSPTSIQNYTKIYADIPEESSLTITESIIEPIPETVIQNAKIENDIPETVIEGISNQNTKNSKSESDKSSSQTKKYRQATFVRVDVDALQRLNYLAGELLINQKRRTLQDEQLKEIIEQLSEQLYRHQGSLNELRDLPLQMQNFAQQRRKNVVSVDFDSLEMDDYSEFHLTLHEVTEEALQLQETTESLDLLLKQSTQIHDKNQRLLFGMLDTLVEARMLPLGNILTRFPQMVQNLGSVYGKRVELQLTGTQVLVDKAIAEKLYDPILQLVRNAFDHGVETPQARRELGKQEQGIIEIRAYHQGSQTIIEVRDDGQGLNLDKIKRKGIQLGLIAADSDGNSYNYTPTEDELLELLFSPGFSTANKVSEISGRGMGLDIVRSQLHSLSGSISIHSSPNQGTTFILKIPFSMTTDQLMIVQAGGAVYALLLDSIEKILLPGTEQVKEFEGKKVLHFNTGKDERMVSLRRLSDLMFYSGSFVSGVALHSQVITNDVKENIKPVLLLRRNHELLGLEVDQIVGEQELVIRPLGNAIIPPKYIYGCSSLANGNLILVIDGAVLIESSEMQVSLDMMSLPGNHIRKKALPMSNISQSIQPTALLTPSTPVNDVAVPSPSPSPSHNPVINKSSKVVLVVDDAISLRQTLSLTLQKYGYHVIQAQNGVEALEQLQRYPEIKLVVSDLEMPRMNGFELLTNLRQTNVLINKPVIILTSRSAEKHRKLAQALGATAYLTKPYLEHEFISTVDNLIDGKGETLSHLFVKP